MNLQEEILKIKNEMLDEFDKRVESLKEQQEFPQDGDMYWIIEDSTEVSRYAWEGDDFDNQHLPVGNVFKTREQAEFAVEKLKVEAELRKLSGHFEEGKNNYFMVFDTNYASVDILGMSYSRVQGVIYFESEEKGQQAIESVGEYRIKKYIFGVED